MLNLAKLSFFRHPVLCPDLLFLSIDNLYQWMKFIACFAVYFGLYLKISALWLFINLCQSPYFEKECNLSVFGLSIAPLLISTCSWALHTCIIYNILYIIYMYWLDGDDDEKRPYKRKIESISSNNVTNIIIREYSEIKLYRYQN